MRKKTQKLLLLALINIYLLMNFLNAVITCLVTKNIKIAGFWMSGEYALKYYKC